MRYFHFIKTVLIASVILFSISSCSTKKNTGMTRAYHDLTARFNVYFNGIESFKVGLRKVDKNYKDDYSTILPVFKYTQKEAVSIITPEMDRSIQKSAKLIKTHSITVKPKVDKKKKLSKAEKEFLNKSEYCKWIDDAYMMMGKAHYFKQEYFTAEQTFLLVANRFKQELSYYDAQLWLAKTKIETKDYEGAETLLKEVRKSPKTPKSLMQDVYLAYADMYLKRKDYSAAIKFLEKSIPLVKDKRFKIRLHFILGQLYQLEEKYNKAEANYVEVAKTNYDYEMTFNAKIRLAEISEKTKSDKSKLKKQLLKMAKDDKNYDYLDQIYYALGRMELNSKNIPEAVKYFSKAVSARTSNKMVKAKAYKVLADYYAEKDNYSLAAAYYDSTLTSINKSFADYEQLYPVIESKSRLMHDLSIIKEQDSLQFVAKLPERERNKIIDKLIKKVVEEEKAANVSNTNNPTGFDPAFDNISNAPTNMSGGKWYFYNPQAVSYGLSNFKSRWGDRTLEDLWRLSNKKAVSDFKEETKNKADTTQVAGSGKKGLSNKTREFYLADLPTTPEKLEQSNKKIEDAMFDAAMIYAEKMNEPDEAITMFEKFLTRFPETAKRLDALQKLYELSNSQGDYERTNKYKQMIISEFPESINAKILSDPNYLSKLREESKKSEKVYEDAYFYYDNGSYNQAITLCEKAVKEFPDDALTPKFMYLSAISYGELGNKEKLKEGLELLVKKFPDDELSKVARKTLEVMATGKFDENLYSPEPGALHYYIIVAPVNKVDFNKLKFDYLSFNLDNFDDKNLQVSRVKLDDEQDMIVVAFFKNATDAMQYFNKIKQEKVLGAYRLVPYKHFVISEGNYKKFLKDQNADKYVKFFTANYR